MTAKEWQSDETGPARGTGGAEGAQALSDDSAVWPNGVGCPVVGDWCPGDANGVLCTKPCIERTDA